MMMMSAIDKLLDEKKVDLILNISTINYQGLCWTVKLGGQHQGKLFEEDRVIKIVSVLLIKITNCKPFITK